MLHTRVSQIAPHQGLRRAVGLAEAERLARLRVVPALAHREALDVVGVEPVGRIVAGDFADPRLVAVAGDVSVGNPRGHPGAALAARSGADDLQNPRLLRIGHRDRLALVAVAVFGDQAVITWIASRAVRARCKPSVIIRP